MQMFLRRNHPDSFAGERSFLYGRSTANQRIEGWWGILRKQSAQFWMKLSRKMGTGDFLDKSLIQFCYLNLVQDELDEVVNTWNSHKIRPRSTDDTASGRPVIMYSFPELHSAEDRLKPIAMEEGLSMGLPRNLCTCRNYCKHSKRENERNEASENRSTISVNAGCCGKL
ncbi:hypothetical protein NQZ68_032986 [Dissostichus eleginoides]|nr:hypothetical protein NQZ68_032986 [Dissostichus eleginoides]